MIDKVELLNGLLHEEKQALSQALVDCVFSKGDTVCKQGENGDAFYIVKEGRRSENYVKLEFQIDTTV